MMKRIFTLGITTAVLGAASLAACTQPTSDTSERSSEVEQSIIGGAPATGDKYAAVGALVEGLEYPGYGFIPFQTYCTATLVAPGAVLTARHCTVKIDNPTYPELSTYFAIGDNAYDADQYIPVTNYVAADPAPGSTLLLDGGRDIAVVHLESDAENVTPAKIGRFSHHMVGRRFEIAGYGYNDDLVDGPRYAGMATVRALAGRWYSLLFNRDRHAYFEWYFTDAVTNDPTWQEGIQWFRTYRLEPGYEALVGGLEGDSIGCFGDSGGPLLRGDSADSLTTYGVGFATEASKSNVCDLGSAFLVFKKRRIREFLDAAL
jgi:hypothetical protein